ncbi:retrovirus-related pol polyprotein from transposon TNT 1-94 [Tanacetum coccineum]
MATISNVPQLVDNKGGSYSAVAPHDILESVISCETAKDTWTDLVYSFEGPSDTKKNRILDLKLEYQTFRAKTSKTLSQTYTRYKTLLNELANDGDFQENSNDEAHKRTSEEYLRDLDIEFHERALLANLKHFIKRKNKFLSQKANQDTECYKCGKKGHFARDFFSKTYEPSYKSPTSYSSLVSKGFQPKFTPKLIQSSQHAQSSQAEPKRLQDRNKGLVAETFDWDEEEVSDDKEETQVKVLMALADDELSVGKNHDRNGEWIDITMKKVNILLSMDENSDWQNYLKYIHIDLKYKKQQKDVVMIRGGYRNGFVMASSSLKRRLDYDHEMVLKSKDWVERFNSNSKLPNINTGRILVPESKAVNECLQLT